MLKARQNFNLPQCPLAVCLVFKGTNLLDSHFHLLLGICG